MYVCILCMCMYVPGGGNGNGALGFLIATDKIMES